MVNGDQVYLSIKPGIVTLPMLHGVYSKIIIKDR